MVKCDGCGNFVKRNKAKSTTIDGMQRLFCCNLLSWQKYETLMEAGSYERQVFGLRR